MPDDEGRLLFEETLPDPKGRLYALEEEGKYLLAGSRVLRVGDRESRVFWLLDRAGTVLQTFEPYVYSYEDQLSRRTFRLDDDGLWEDYHVEWSMDSEEEHERKLIARLARPVASDERLGRKLLAGTARWSKASREDYEKLKRARQRHESLIYPDTQAPFDDSRAWELEELREWHDRLVEERGRLDRKDTEEFIERCKRLETAYRETLSRWEFARDYDDRFGARWLREHADTLETLAGELGAKAREVLAGRKPRGRELVEHAALPPIPLGAEPESPPSDWAVVLDVFRSNPLAWFLGCLGAGMLALLLPGLLVALLNWLYR